MRTRELHGPGYYLFGSQADPGYAEQMRATNRREDEDPQRQDPPKGDMMLLLSEQRHIP